MADAKLKYLVRDKDRHGNERLYVRIAGRKERLREQEGKPAFFVEYAKAVEKLQRPAEAELAPKKEKLATVPLGSLEAVGRAYFASVEFQRLEEKSQRTRRSVLNSCFDEPPRPGSTARMGDCPIKKIDSAAVRMLRDRKAATPGAANNRLKYLSAMFGWAIENDKMLTNPVRDVRALDYESDGWRVWEEAEIAQFEQRWPIGTKERLALALLMFTGTRRVDMVQLGPQHIVPTRITDETGGETVEDWIKFKPSKTRKSTGRIVEVPLLPELAQIIKATTATGIRTFLVTGKGEPYTANGFGNWMREICDAAGLPECTAHGVRKAGATRAAERGASTKQLMAIFGWNDPKQAETYIRKANQKRLAMHATRLLGRDPKNRA